MPVQILYKIRHQIHRSQNAPVVPAHFVPVIQFPVLFYGRKLACKGFGIQATRLDPIEQIIHILPGTEGKQRIGFSGRETQAGIGIKPQNMPAEFSMNLAQEG